MRINNPNGPAFPFADKHDEMGDGITKISGDSGLTKREYAVIHLFAAMCGNAQEPINAGNVQMWAKMAEIAVDCWIH